MDDVNPIDQDMIEKRRWVADALTEDPNEENPYVLQDEPSEMARLRLAKEYVKITEYLMERSDGI